MAKTKTIITIMMIVFSLLIVQTVAADLTLNGDSFEFDFSNLDDRDEELEDIQTITIENTGTLNESVAFSVSLINSKFTVELQDSSDDSFTLAPDEVKTIDVILTADVTSGINPGDYEDLVEITADNSADQITLDLDAEVRSMLILDRVTFHLDGSFESRMDGADSGDGDEDVTVDPDSVVRMYFLLENLYDEDFRDGDIDGTISITLDDNDFGDEIEEEVDFNLGAGDETDEGEEIYVEFDVPFTAEDGIYDITIEIDADDENGADFIIEWTAELQIEREDDDVRIENLNFAPSSVSCSRFVALNVDVVNYGSNRQRNAAVSIQNEELGIHEIQTLSLGYGYDEDENSESLLFNLQLDDSVPAKSYEFKLRSFYDRDEISDLKKINLVVEECVIPSTPEPVVEPEVVVIEESLPANEAVPEESLPATSSGPTGSVINTTERSYTFQDLVFGLLFALILLILANVVLVVILGFKSLNRQKKD
jgi:hypothetical protein